MAKMSKQPAARASSTGALPKGRKLKPVREGKTGRFVLVDPARLKAVMSAAEQSGLLGEKSARIGGRISPALLEQAKKQTGIRTDTDLIEFALANVALEDDFADTFAKVRGTVDPALKLGF